MVITSFLTHKTKEYQFQSKLPLKTINGRIKRVLLISLRQRRSRVLFPGCKEGNLENEAQSQFSIGVKIRQPCHGCKITNWIVKEKPKITALVGVCQAKIQVRMSLCPKGNEHGI